MKNPDESAYPTAAPGQPQAHVGGLTKREKTCIELGVPESGDPELDDIIRKAERKKAAMASWTSGEIGNMANTIVDEINDEDRNFEDYVGRTDPKVMAKARVRLADELLNELED